MNPVFTFQPNAKTYPRRFKASGVFLPGFFRNHSFPGRRAPEIVVKSTRTGIGAVKQSVNGFQSFLFAFQFFNPVHLVNQPQCIVKRNVDVVDKITAASGCMVFFNRKLCPETAEKRIGQSNTTFAQFRRNRFFHRCRQSFPGFLHGHIRHVFTGVFQNVAGFALQTGFINQPALGVGIKIGADESALETRVDQHMLRRCFFHVLPLLKGALHLLVGNERPAEILFQRHQCLRHIVGILRTDKIAGIFAQVFQYQRFRVPVLAGPDKFIHIIVGTFGIADASAGQWCIKVVNVFFVFRTGIDTFAAQCHGKGNVPVGNRILATDAVGNIGV